MGQAAAYCDGVNALTEQDQLQIRLDIGSSLHGVTVITNTGLNTKEFHLYCNQVCQLCSISHNPEK